MLTYSDALTLLKAVGCSEHVINHCKQVSEKSKELALKLLLKSHKVDVELCTIGGLLHDIGRSKTHSITHGVEGAKLLEAYPNLARIAKTHTGAGIDKAEAKKLGLPPGDYIPRTVEEKIVCYSDKLSDNGKISDNVIPRVKRMENELGKDHSSIQRLKKLEKEIKKLITP
ncbi:HD domain protein [Candidatus Tiddalikarchaeum anstoanum]|nr:HD domain protein [Candidatus Tiddalikarchaeum anstoanum]